MHEYLHPHPLPCNIVMFGTKTFMLTVPLEASVLSYSRIYTLH